MAHPVMVTKSKSSVLFEPDVLKDVTTEEIYRELLRRMGEDPTRDGLLATPARVEKSMAYLTKGYSEDPLQLLRGALFDVDYDEMVIVKM